MSKGHGERRVARSIKQQKRRLERMKKVEERRKAKRLAKAVQEGARP